LTKPTPSLVLLNAQGRNLPWTFVLTEMEFCTTGQMFPCIDENFCKTLV
jgi:hypothetical protein